MNRKGNNTMVWLVILIVVAFILLYFLGTKLIPDVFGRLNP